MAQGKVKWSMTQGVRLYRETMTEVSSITLHNLAASKLSEGERSASYEKDRGLKRLTVATLKELTSSPVVPLHCHLRTNLGFQ